MRTQTTIRIEKELIEKAQKYGLNLSRTVENLLKIYLEGIEQLQNKIKQQTTSKTPFSLSEGSLFGKRESSKAGPLGFEPRISGLEGRRAIQATPRTHDFHSVDVEYSFYSLSCLNSYFDHFHGIFSLNFLKHQLIIILGERGWLANVRGSDK